MKDYLRREITPKSKQDLVDGISTFLVYSGYTQVPQIYWTFEKSNSGCN